MNSTEFVNSQFTKENLERMKLYDISPEVLSDMLKLEEMTLILKFPKFLIEPLKNSNALISFIEEMFINTMMSEKDIVLNCIRFYISNEEKE